MASARDQRASDLVARYGRNGAAVRPALARSVTCNRVESEKPIKDADRKQRPLTALGAALLNAMGKTARRTS